MKIKKVLISGATAVALLTAGSFMNHVSASSNNSNKSEYLTSYPKSMRGTWYYYSQDAGKVKITIDKNSFKQKTSKDSKDNNYSSSLHKYVDHNPFKAPKKTNDWSYASKIPGKTHGVKWINIQGWNSTAGDGLYYNVKNINGNKVLTEATGAYVTVADHAYQSPSVAKKLQHKQYSGFKY